MVNSYFKTSSTKFGHLAKINTRLLFESQRRNVNNQIIDYEIIAQRYV